MMVARVFACLSQADVYLPPYDATQGKGFGQNKIWTVIAEC